MTVAGMDVRLGSEGSRVERAISGWGYWQSENIRGFSIRGAAAGQGRSSARARQEGDETMQEEQRGQPWW